MKTFVAITLLALSTVTHARGAGGHASGGHQSHSGFPSAYSNSNGGFGSAQGTHSVSGHVRSDGTYVQPHMQTNPNATRNDNWSTRGNINPYTGTLGTKPRDGQ
ncbi:hypothetical protein [Cupriavidus sp. CP313]